MLNIYSSSKSECIPPEGKRLDFLINETAQKNKQAFEELYKSTSKSVYAYALSILKNAYDAQDVMHDCYLSIYSSAHLYSSRNKPMAWILTICKNLCLKKINERKKSCEISENIFFTDEQNSNLNYDDKAVIEKCLMNLNEEEREIVILHSVAGFKHKEIADISGLRLSTVLSKYNRAIKKLKVFLSEEGENYDK